MNDKSPRNNMSKKSGKSIKEKRAEKRAKDAPLASVVPSTRKKPGR